MTTLSSESIKQSEVERQLKLLEDADSDCDDYDVELLSYEDDLSEDDLSDFSDCEENFEGEGESWRGYILSGKDKERSGKVEEARPKFTSSSYSQSSFTNDCRNLSCSHCENTKLLNVVSS